MLTRFLQGKATSWDHGCQKRPLLTPFLTPVVPRRARNRVLSILALSLFLPVSDFTQPENGLPTPPLSLPYTGCHQTASYSPKMAPLHFCTSGSEMPLTEEPGLYKRPCPPSPSHSVSTTNTLSGALCLRPLPSASRTSSSLLPPAPPSPLTPSRCAPPSFVACCNRRPLCHPPTTGRRTCSTFPSHSP